MQIRREARGLSAMCKFGRGRLYSLTGAMLRGESCEQDNFVIEASGSDG
jgi:hypothetical protein